jgi:hypothetical protein
MAVPLVLSPIWINLGTGKVMHCIKLKPSYNQYEMRIEPESFQSRVLMCEENRSALMAAAAKKLPCEVVLKCMDNPPQLDHNHNLKTEMISVMLTELLPAELVQSNVVVVMRFKCPQCGPKYGADLNESDLPYGCYRCGRKDLEFVS